VGKATNAFTVAPDNRILYVSSFVGGTVTEFDMFAHQILRTSRSAERRRGWP
jgi:hypothetical protein